MPELNSQLAALEAPMLPLSTDDCFSMLLTDLDFSAPVQPYDNAVDPSEIPIDYILGMSHGVSQEIPYGCCHGSLTAKGCAPNQHDLHFPSGRPSLASQDLGAQYGSQATFANATASSLPYEQLYQELGNSQIHALSQQQEGMKRALQLMGHLCYPEDSSAYTRLSPSEYELWANTLVERCRKVTGIVSDMLKCHKSEDGYFLAVVCLVMSKVLDAYVKASQALSARGSKGQSVSLLSESSTLSSLSAAASESSDSSTSPTAREGDPKAFQQLLDELYQVRASMDLLGAKITSMPLKRDCIFGNDLDPSYYDTLASTLPFSAEILNRLYNEQRRRLKTISLRLINNLKAFWIEEHSV